MKCDIIIPVWNQLESTRECVDNLIRNTGPEYRIIFIDNGSDVSTKKYLEDFKASASVPVEIVRNEKNLGFVKAVNQGLRISTAPYVCVLNNDTIPAQGWLERMMKFAESHKDVGLINPQCCGHGSAPIETYAKMLEKNVDKFMEMNQCFGFCMLIKRELLEKIGCLDEAFGIGGYDDTDYSMRAYRAGYRCVNVHSAYVYHKEHVSFNAMGDRKALVSEGEKVYFKKWPRHIRIGVSFSIDGDTADSEIAGMLKSVLFLAREWTWVNLWIFGNPGKNRNKVNTISEKIGMPLHQNIKFNFVPGMKNLNLVIRLIERSFGTKARKRYDAVLEGSPNTTALLKMLYPIHRTRIYSVNHKDYTEDNMRKIISAARRTRKAK